MTVWFWLTGDMTDVEFEETRLLLSPQERARCDRLLFRHDQRDFAAAHALLRGALSFHTGEPPGSWLFTVDARGKPHLAPCSSRWEFNISHTRGLVACALSATGPVGVDVEAIDRAVHADAIVDSYFTQSEAAAIRRCRDRVERRARFFELWTLKEAYLTALGSGLSRALDEIVIEFSGGSGLHVTSAAGCTLREWTFGLFAPTPRYRLSAAARNHGGTTVTVGAWPPDPAARSLAALRATAINSHGVRDDHSGDPRPNRSARQVD